MVGVGQLLETVLTDARPGGRWFTGGLPTTPLVSVANGTAGLAVALHRVATLRDDPGLAALADEWALRAAAEATREGAFDAPAYELTEKVTGRVTPFHRRSGLYAVQALASHSLDNPGARQAALDGFVAESRQPCENLDVTLGRSGTLLGAAILYEAVAGARYADLTGLVVLGNDTLRDIWAELGSLPPIADGTRQRLLGVAHGWAGFLLATLRWCAVASTPRPAAAWRSAWPSSPASPGAKAPACVGRGPTTLPRRCRAGATAARDTSTCGRRPTRRSAMTVGRPGRTCRLGRLPDARRRPALLRPGRPGLRVAGALPAHRRTTLADRGGRTRRPCGRGRDGRPPPDDPT